MHTIGYSADTAQKAGRTVHSVLKNTLGLSASLISRLKRIPGSMTVDGRDVYVNYVIKEGEYLSVRPCCEAAAEKGTSLPGMPEILYEDGDFLILNKPAGLAVQPVQDESEVTLETYLRAYLGISGRPNPVSRLDRGTSGLMTVAKSGFVQELFKRNMHSAAYQKQYLALLAGTPEEPRGTVEAPIGFTEGSTYARTVRADGLMSVTEYEVLESRGDISLVRLNPVTGRTHQLRVHMAYIGNPMLGDWLYGSRDERILRPALHSYRLTVRHPLTGAVLECRCPLPEDMAGLCKNFACTQAPADL